MTSKERTKQKVKQIIKEEIKKVLSERGFGQGVPAKDELSKKREVYLEDEEKELNPEHYSVEKLSPNKLIRIRKKDSGLVGLYEPDGSYRSGDLRLSKSEVKNLVGIEEGKKCQELLKVKNEKNRA